jgi:hypothetical protein
MWLLNYRFKTLSIHNPFQNFRHNDQAVTFYGVREQSTESDVSKINAETLKTIK